MTINVAVVVGEGLAMAADSVLSMQQNGQWISGFHTGEKLTQLGSRPMALMFHGLAAINNRSILSLVREFEFSHDEIAFENETSVHAVADALRKFISEKYLGVSWGVHSDPAFIWPPYLGIVVGGFSPGHFFAEYVTVAFPENKVIRNYPISEGQPPDGTPCVNWWGMPEALTRLVIGSDVDKITMAVKHLNSQDHEGTNSSIKDLNVNGVFEAVAPYITMNMSLDGMPLQDAVEFADYLCIVAAGYDRFTKGPRAIGGDIDAVAIQREGLFWYRRKDFASQMALARSANNLRVS